MEESAFGSSAGVHRAQRTVSARESYFHFAFSFLESELAVRAARGWRAGPCNPPRSQRCVCGCAERARLIGLARGQSTGDCRGPSPDCIVTDMTLDDHNGFSDGTSDVDLAVRCVHGVGRTTRGVPQRGGSAWQPRPHEFGATTVREVVVRGRTTVRRSCAGCSWVPTARSGTL